MSSPAIATVNLSEAAPLISESVRDALAALGLVICERLSGEEVLGEFLAPIDAVRAKSVLDELGRNAAGVLAANAD